MSYRLLAVTLCAATSASALTHNGTEYSGISSLSTTSALNNNASFLGMVASLTDDSYLTGVANVGILNSALDPGNGGSLEGNFTQSLLASSSPQTSGVAIFGPGFAEFWGSFEMQLRLADGSYTTAVTFDANTLSEIIGVTIPANTLYHNYSGFGTYVGPAQRVVWSQVALSTFGAISQDVTGIKITNFTPQFAELSFIGVYGSLGGGSSIPEPSTYGLIFGSMALAMVVARKRRLKKDSV